MLGEASPLTIITNYVKQELSNYYVKLSHRKYTYYIYIIVLSIYINSFKYVKEPGSSRLSFQFLNISWRQKEQECGPVA